MPAMLKNSSPVPARRSKGAATRSRGAFTLTELLVVIALIVLLVALLLTALGGVQRKSRESKTVSTMQAFANACEAFYQEHNFYPGVVPEGVLTGQYDNEVPPLSGTENAALHLIGGFVRKDDDEDAYDDQTRYPPSEWTELEVGVENPTYKIKVSPRRFGEGPVIGGKPYAPYLTLSENELGAVAGQSGDLQLPDVLDAWGQPIIYLRRQRSIGPLVGTPNQNPQFGVGPIRPYLVEALGKLGRNQIYHAQDNSGGSILSGEGGDAETNLGKVIEHPSLAGQPRGAFMLLSAGPDGVYFSAQDGPGTPTADVYDVADRIDNGDLPPTIFDQYDDVLMFGGSD